ncbi:hypothetical protein [Tautonia sociabilis]|uniref:Oligosaccharide repeat unit polymerase n=1 Tax=Tautonia sociabilis TaxID=2080755 RepID=A0A432MQH9_9BACT|nr:hypothetical protein [Tautonia sociabilis]RUL89753.1 hypothetical protein TsocGM_00895 [Tautonia sociabilis]
MEMDRVFVLLTAAVILSLVGYRVCRRDFDPFAPIWLFLTGYAHVYVLQAYSFRDWALATRPIDVVTTANARALWALLLFLAVYYSGIGRLLARQLPRPPRRWATGPLAMMVPLMAAWGLICTAVVVRKTAGQLDTAIGGWTAVALQFPTMQLIAGTLLIVTGRQPHRPRPALTLAGLALTLMYTLVWMYLGKRSHSLFGVLTLLCAWYLPRFKRPSLGTLAAAAFLGCLVVALAISWRLHRNRGNDASVDSFVAFAAEFDPSAILVSLSIEDEPGRDLARSRAQLSRETTEYGGYLLMLDTVPNKSPHDYGLNYLRLVSTYIPRVVWPEKPIYGRDRWVSAWVAGSEFKRKDDFTGPAIGILGAAQLNGGATATVLVMVVVAVVIRTGYDYFRYHADAPWAQAWWASTYFNAWLMTVNDDPAVWFYYLYGHMILPPLVFLWVVNRLGETRA